MVMPDLGIPKCGGAFIAEDIQRLFPSGNTQMRGSVSKPKSLQTGEVPRKRQGRAKNFRITHYCLLPYDA